MDNGSDSELIEQMRDRFDLRRAFWNFIQVFVFGYATISGLILIWGINEEGLQWTMKNIDFDSATSPWLLIIPGLIGIGIAFLRGIVRPEFDAGNQKQLNAYLEAQKIRNWAGWQKGLLLVLILMVLTLPFIPDSPVSEETIARIEIEAAQVGSPELDEKLLEIRSDGVVLQSEFNEFLNLSLTVQARRFKEENNRW